MTALDRAGIAAHRTREPGGSPGAEAIRGLLLGGANDRWDAWSEVFLFCAARRDHVTTVIEPALAKGEWVVCDRFADSTLAYQGYGRGLALTDLIELQRLTLTTHPSSRHPGEGRDDGVGGSVLTADLTLILDLPVETGFARIAARPGGVDRFERLDREFHKRLRQGFLDIAAQEPQRCAVIDAAGDAAAVHRAILAAVNERLGVDLT
jgi:dTMP kinase